MEKHTLTEKSVSKALRNDSVCVLIVTPIVVAFALAVGSVCLITVFARQGYFEMAIIAAGMIYAIVACVRECYKAVCRIRFMPKRPTVVLAQRVAAPKNMPEEYHKGRHNSGYYLYFEHYGQYAVSAGYAGLTPREIWECFMVGESFYLVLDHKYQILFAYPCNLFEYDGELTKHTIVNGKIQRV